MAKSKRTRNLPSKKNIKASQSLFKNQQDGQFQMGTYPIGEELAFFSPYHIAQEGFNRCAAAIITIYLLVQIRSLKLTSRPTEVDRLPCFKFFKKSLLSGTCGRTLAFFLAVSNPQVVTHIPEDIDTTIWLQSVFELFAGNEKKLQSVNEKNVVQYIHGEMSRLLGIMNSTPSNNREILGIMVEPINFKISDVLATIRSSQISKVDIPTVVELIRKECGISYDSDGQPISPIQFAEPPLISEGSVNGGCALEQEIFGPAALIRVSSLPSVTSASKEKPPILTPEQYSPFLSPLQQSKYAAAVVLKNYNIISTYNEIVNKASDS